MGHGGEGDALPAVADVASVSCAAVGFEGVSPASAAVDGLGAGVFAPAFVCGAEFGCGRPVLGVELAFVFDEFGEGVVFGAVLGGVVADAFEDREAVLLPVEASVDEPGEDCGLFGGIGS
jgi:hypothetical protein